MQCSCGGAALADAAELHDPALRDPAECANGWRPGEAHHEIAPTVQQINESWLSSGAVRDCSIKVRPATIAVLVEMVDR